MSGDGPGDEGENTGNRPERTSAGDAGVPPGEGAMVDASLDYAGPDELHESGDSAHGSTPSANPAGSAASRLGWARRREPGPSRHTPHARPHAHAHAGPATSDRARDGARPGNTPTTPARPAIGTTGGPEPVATATDSAPGAPGAVSHGPSSPGRTGSSVPAPARGLRILARALGRPRGKGTQLMIGLLCGLLGFFAVVQIRLQAGSGTLRNARQSDLIRVLDDLNDRSDRLSGEIRDLESRRTELQSGTNAAKAALNEALKRKAVLGILSGTVSAHGPGITLRITDPLKKVDAAVLLDALEELRDAGAEAEQINGVRVIASTSFLDAGRGQVRIDGHLVAEPYVFAVIGDPGTLEPALRIPGGVFAVLDGRGATPTLQPAPDVSVDAIRPAALPQYAKPIAPGN
jgi:uncharacterized protein YlxW (UPF0749 family)